MLNNDTIKNRLLLVLMILFACSTTGVCSSPLPKPKLVVGIVIDQMRWDYIYRYYDRYSENGFRRFLTEGVSCENTMLTHIPTITAVGHATLFTGTVPAIHGIAGNDIYLPELGRTVYCLSDPQVQTVGSPSNNGKMSPRNLLTTTIGDELRIATHFQSKVIGVAIKDRASILPAGHAANAAYWYDPSNGAFITSTHYRNDLPQWLKNFNAQDNARKLTTGEWNTLFPIETYTVSTPDNVPYESPYFRGQSPTMPVNLDSLWKRDGYGAVRNIPQGNTLTLDMARAAIEGEQLGKGAFTDMITISCSTPDMMGHEFGPQAVEMEDMYLRLDRELASFFKYLDKQIGKGKYLIFLTADHAGSNNMNFLRDHNIPAVGFDVSATDRMLKDSLRAIYGASDLIRGVGTLQVQLNYRTIESRGIDKAELKGRIISWLSRFPGIAYAVDLPNLELHNIPDIIKERIRNGYHPERSGEIQIIPEPGSYEVWGKGPYRGTTHGTWTPPDAHVPLLFYGWGIKPIRNLYREVSIIDIVPTVAAILKIQMPNGCIGKPIAEIIK